jgi:hypothetical protein
MSNFMTVAERVVYKMCPHNPAQTLAVKEAWVESRFYGLGSAIKSFGIERFKHNTVRVSLFFLFNFNAHNKPKLVYMIHIQDDIPYNLCP